MISDRVLGGLITVASIAGMIVYIIILFNIFPLGWDIILMKLTMLAGVLVIGCIAAWIGWTMATTPPPILPEEKPVEKPKKVKRVKAKR